MAELKPQEEPPVSDPPVSRYDDDGRLVTEEEASILPSEWVGPSRKVGGVSHYEAVLIGFEGPTQYKVSVGDCVYLSPDEDAKPWCEVGLVTHLYLAQTGDFAGEKVVKVRWLYRNTQVPKESARNMHICELYYGLHDDENLVESIKECRSTHVSMKQYTFIMK
eukprot:1293850-Pleurochrysis_carterae.AAC.3